MATVIVLAYALLARKEERRMERQFGEAYLAYERRVPMFIPRWGRWGQLLAVGNGDTRQGSPSR